MALTRSLLLAYVLCASCLLAVKRHTDINYGLIDVVKVKDTKTQTFEEFVPVTQAVYTPVSNAKTEHKGVWLDGDKVIVKPKGKEFHKDSTESYFGFGLVSRQLDWAIRYKDDIDHKNKKQQNSGQQQNNKQSYPAVHVFLVRKQAFDQLAKKTQAQNTGAGKVQLVDTQAPNQVLLGSEGIETLRQNILPGSLVTYTDGKLDPAKFGEIRKMDEFRNIFKYPKEEFYFSKGNNILTSRSKSSNIGFQNNYKEVANKLDKVLESQNSERFNEAYNAYLGSFEGDTPLTKDEYHNLGKRWASLLRKKGSADVEKSSDDVKRVWTKKEYDRDSFNKYTQKLKRRLAIIDKLETTGPESISQVNKRGDYVELKKELQSEKMKFESGADLSSLEEMESKATKMGMVFDQADKCRKKRSLRRGSSAGCTVFPSNHGNTGRSGSSHSNEDTDRRGTNNRPSSSHTATGGDEDDGAGHDERTSISGRHGQRRMKKLWSRKRLRSRLRKRLRLRARGSRGRSRGRFTSKNRKQPR